MEDVSQVLRESPEIQMAIGEPQVGIDESVELTSTPVLHTSVCVRGVSHVRHMSRVMSDRIWVSDFDNIILTDTTGDIIHRVTNITKWFGVGIHTVNSSCELIYINNMYSISQFSLVTNRVTTLIQSTPPWRPRCVYFSPSTGDLVVGMCNTDTHTSIVTRYNSSGQHILTIQHDNEGHMLYDEPNFITENKNGDIIVSDEERVVVTARGGRHRFYYKGPTPGSLLLPWGVCTDALSHILVCDYHTGTVQMIDKDGHFLCLLLTEQHGIKKPLSMNYDDQNHLLWVGSLDTNTVSVYRYKPRQYSLTYNPDGDEEITETSSYEEAQESGTDLEIGEEFESKDNSEESDPDDKDTAESGTFEGNPDRDEDITNALSYKETRESGTDLEIGEEFESEESNEESYPDDKDTAEPGTSEGKTKGDVSNIMAETLMPKRRGEPKKNGEADIQKSLSVNSLHNETKSRKLKRSQSMNKDYIEILGNLDYLDCVGLSLVNEVKQGMTNNPFLRSMEPFPECNVHTFIKWMEECKKVLQKPQSTKWGSVSFILFAVYTKKAILEFNEQDLFEIIDHSTRCAIESENCILVSELIRTYLFDYEFQLQRMFEDMKVISPAIIDTVLQTVRTLILRKFRNRQNNAIDLSLCKECGRENRLVMVITYKGNLEMKDRIPDKVLGFELVLYNFTQPSDEASSVFKSIPVSKKTPLPTVTESEARELFRKHSNLTMISASPYKFIGYSNGKHRVVEKLCISLFCLHKGYIPYGEEQFPKKIRDIEVDVQDGYCYFGAGRSLELGGHITRFGSGTIGGFVDLRNKNVGLITCAHVVFSPEELFYKPPIYPSQIKVEAFDKRHHSYNVCGKCERAEFPQCYLIGQDVSKPDSNVDAALIEVDQDIDTFEFRTVISEQLQSAGFDPSNPPVFSGEIVSLPDPVPVYKRIEQHPNNSGIVVKYVTANGTTIGQDYVSNPTSGEFASLHDSNPVFNVGGKIPNKSDSVVKYGGVTGFTIGSLYLNRVHVRFLQESLNLPGNLHYAVMCDQIEIQNLPQGHFFEVGDSGSFVFCINPDKTLSCLGMAVGLTSRNSCLVTPIGRILENLCPDARLKPCGPSGILAHLQAILQLMSGEIMNME